MQTRYKATTKSFCQQQCCATAVARVVKRKTRFQFVTTNQTKMQYNQQPAGAPGYPHQMPPPSYEQVVHVQAPVRVVHHTTAPPPVVIIQRGFFFLNVTEMWLTLAMTCRSSCIAGGSGSHLHHLPALPCPETDPRGVLAQRENSLHGRHSLHRWVRFADSHQPRATILSNLWWKITNSLWCCACLPYCATSCMNANHFCGNCNKFVGVYNSD